MAKYIKKLVIVDAIQWTGKNHQYVLDFTDGTNANKPYDVKFFVIPTIDGDKVADVGDWIVKSIEGEFSCYTNEYFEMTYSRVYPSI